MTYLEVLEGLKSNDVDKQVDAVAEGAVMIRLLITESVGVFKRTPSRFAIAAHLVCAGEAVRPALESLFAEQLDEEARAHTSAMLLELGSQIGVPFLLSMLKSRGPFALMAAVELSKAGIAEARDAIQTALEVHDVPKDPYTAATLINALQRYGELSEDFKGYLRERYPPPMRFALDQLFQTRHEAGRGD